MSFGCKCYAVRANLVGRVSVGGDAVRPGNDDIDVFGFHGPGRHVVGNGGDGNIVFQQFPGCEARALQQGPGFIRIHHFYFPLFMGGTNYAQSGSPATGGQRSRIAVR